MCRPLLEILLACALGSGLPTPAASAQDSVADAARKNRPKDAQVTSKRVWTNDDIPPTTEKDSSFTAAENKESESAALERFRNLDKETLGRAVLRLQGAPDVDFTNRRDWEQRLFEAKQAWLDQVDRMVAHKDSSKDSQEEEIRRAEGTRRIFERIVADGVRQARAVNDPVLKAHLEYEQQQDFCRQTSGDMLTLCLANLQQLRWKMEREGTW